MKILFYDDAPEYGGHEIMTLAAARHLLVQPQSRIGFMYFGGNQRLGQQLAKIKSEHSGFDLMPQDYASGRLQSFRTWLSPREIRAISAAMRAYSPDLVILAQGAIAYCSAGLLAAKRADIRTLSYIPLTHPESMFSASAWRAALREPVNRLYYRMVDEYITVSPRMERYLRNKGLRQPVAIVQAAVDLGALKTVDRSSARAKLGLHEGDLVVAVIGRVQFWQKRQDLAVAALELARRQIPGLKLLIVGDGPDLAALKTLVRSKGLDEAVTFTGWSDDLDALYAAMDVLMIPSRFEGVPLVMLLAMYFERAVIASAVDGMADILPSHWLFPSGDAAALAARLVETARSDCSRELQAHSALVHEIYSLEAFQTAFSAAALAAAQRGGHGMVPAASA